MSIPIFLCAVGCLAIWFLGHHQGYQHALRDADKTLFPKR